MLPLPCADRSSRCFASGELSSRGGWRLSRLTWLLFHAGEKLWEVQCESPTFTVAWHPKRPLLAFACDDKDGKYDSSREAGTVKLFGLPNDS